MFTCKCYTNNKGSSLKVKVMRQNKVIYSQANLNNNIEVCQIFVRAKEVYVSDVSSLCDYGLKTIWMH